MSLHNQSHTDLLDLIRGIVMSCPVGLLLAEVGSEAVAEWLDGQAGYSVLMDSRLIKKLEDEEAARLANPEIELIKKIALKSGFKLRIQPGGKADLNPYVYEFAAQLVHTVISKALEDADYVAGGYVSEYEIQQAANDMVCSVRSNQR